MKLTYDLRHNFAYLRICAKPDSVKTIQISDELNVVAVLLPGWASLRDNGLYAS